MSFLLVKNRQRRLLSLARRYRWSRALTQLVDHLLACLHSPSSSPIQRYLMVRDIAFFVIDFFTGDRASNLGRLQSHSVFQLPDQRGFLLNFSFGKTLRGGGTPTRPFVLLPVPSLRIYPVAWFQYYLEYCKAMSISLHPGYVFRTSSAHKFVSNRPFVGSAVNNRLRSHLLQIGIHSGETPHSFRVVVASTLGQLGFSADDVALYVGWRSTESARHYTKPAAAGKLISIFNIVADTISLAL